MVLLLLLYHGNCLLLLFRIGGNIKLLPFFLLEQFFILLGVLQGGVTAAEGLHQLTHRFGHVRVEFTLLGIHSLHVLLRVLDLPPGTVDVLVVFLRVVRVLFCFRADVHTLGTCFKETAENVGAMSCSGATVLHGRYPAHVRMTHLLLLLLEWQVLVKLRHICDLLKLIRITLHLLLQVLHSLRNTLGDLEIMLHLLHGSTDLGLFQGVLRQCLVSVFQLPDLFLLQVDFGHFAVVVSQLLIIVVVGWLLVFLQLVDWLLALLFAFLRASIFALVFLSDDHYSLVGLLK